MVKITCSSCNKPLSIDETKLPMKEVSFPCPACKTKLSIDRRNLPAAGTGAPAATVPAVDPNGSEIVAGDQGDDDFGAKALIVGEESEAIRNAVRQVGLQPIHRGSPEEAREYFVQEFPPVIVLSPSQPGPPPLEEMRPLTSVTPADRRRGFFILVTDNVRTLDGSAAFLYGVNLVVASKDLPSFSKVYRDAYTYHERLYQTMKSILDS